MLRATASWNLIPKAALCVGKFRNGVGLGPQSCPEMLRSGATALGVCVRVHVCVSARECVCVCIRFLGMRESMCVCPRVSVCAVCAHGVWVCVSMCKHVYTWCQGVCAFVCVCVCTRCLGMSMCVCKRVHTGLRESVCLCVHTVSGSV